MYSASEAFHNAVANGAHQMALLIFDDAVFTNDDINVTAGIEFNDYFNTEEDMAIGQALSNEISFSVFNDHGLLNNYGFGDFTATIGAQIGNETIVPATPPYDPSSTTLAIIKEPDDAIGQIDDTISFTVVATGVTSYQWQYSSTGSSWKNSSMTGYNTATGTTQMTQSRYNQYSYRCKLTGSSGTIYTRPVRMVLPGETLYVEDGTNSYTTYARAPFVRRNKSMTTISVSYAPKTLLVYGDSIYMRLSNGSIVRRLISNGSTASVTMNVFMKAQMQKWEGKGIAYTQASGENWKLRIWKGANLRTYEFVPLGVFTAERPNVPYVNEIQMTCYDKMQVFEKDMPDDTDLGLTYPCTFSNLFVKMCTYLGVQYGSTDFINGTAQLSERPEEFDNATMRDVLQWLAEAACSVARFNRDGVLVMDWLRSSQQVIDENGYSEFNPYWYETKKVTKVYNRASSGDYENTTGAGDEAYLIQDNPLLKGVS